MFYWIFSKKYTKLLTTLFRELFFRIWDVKKEKSNKWFLKFIFFLLTDISTFKKIYTLELKTIPVWYQLQLFIHIILRMYIFLVLHFLLIFQSYFANFVKKKFFLVVIVVHHFTRRNYFLRIMLSFLELNLLNCLLLTKQKHNFPIFSWGLIQISNF